MSFYSDASLVMIPSGYKDAKVYSAKPVDGSGDLDFSRGSDIEATRVNANGYIEKAQVNLLLQSNSFSTTWSPSASISVTGGQSGYDGSSDAWLLERSDTSARYINQNITLPSAVYSYSVYAKADSVDWLYMWSYDGSGSVSAYFDLANGLVGTTSGLIYTNIEAVGGGWYRCSMSYNNNIAAVRLYPAVADGSTTGGVAPAGIYIQDSQLNYGLVAQDYVETTTAAVVSGITNDMPRLNYDPANPTCPSLLLEPSRQNLVPQAEYLGVSDWVKLGAGAGSAPVITENYATSPEGVQNATRVQLDLNGGTSSSDQSLFYDDLGGKTGTFTRSIYIKSLTTDTDLYFGGTLSDFKLISVTTEWQRFDFTSALSGSTLYVTLGLRGTTGSSDSADILVYGFQAEEGSYPTSYIPTYGSSATRTADACSKTSIASLFNDSEGTFFAEIQAVGVDSATKVITIGDGSSLNRVQIFYQAGTNITINVISGGTSQVTGFTTTFDQTQNAKVIIRYANNNAKFFLNGAEIASDTSVTTPTGLSGIYFNNGTGSADFLGLVKQLVYIPSALSDADCITLTA